MKIQIIEIASHKETPKYTLTEFLGMDWHGLHVKYLSEINDVLSKKCYSDSNVKNKIIKKSYLVLINSECIARYDIIVKVEIKIKKEISQNYNPNPSRKAYSEIATIQFPFW